jgi:tetratricopeptide (TPR) repeat protein
MDTIIRSIKKVILAAVILAFPVLSIAQDFNVKASAFKESYELEEKGDYSTAVNTLKKVYQQDDYPLNLRLGWLSYLNGSFIESTAYYNKAIQLKPYAIEPRLGLAYPASAMGNWTQVKDQYYKILEIDPQNTLVNYRLGMIAYSNENYPEALKYFEKVVNLYPFDYDSLIMFAWTSLRLGKLREAEVLFKQVLLLNPGDESATEGLKSIQ